MIGLVKLVVDDIICGNLVIPLKLSYFYRSKENIRSDMEDLDESIELLLKTSDIIIAKFSKWNR